MCLKQPILRFGLAFFSICEPPGGISHGGGRDAPGVQGELAQFDGTGGVTAWLRSLGFIFDSKSPGLANWLGVFVNLFCFL